jgi:hypothetical protein
MFESIGRSIDIVKKSFGVLMGEKKLLVFPLISSIALLAVFISFLIPFVFIKNEILTILLLFLFYFVSFFIIILFNSALVHATAEKLEGRSVNLMASMNCALSHVVNIALWALVSATVGVILNMLRSMARNNRGIGGIIGGLVISLVGMAWSVATFFVVPIIIFENAGPLRALKRSMELVRKSFSEQIIGSFAIGAVFGIISLLGIALIVLGFVIPPLLLVLLPAGIILLGILAIAQGAMEGVFLAELYRYASTGQATVFKNEIESAMSARPKVP